MNEHPLPLDASILTCTCY